MNSVVVFFAVLAVAFASPLHQVDTVLGPDGSKIQREIVDVPEKEVLIARTIPIETPVVKEIPIIKEVPFIKEEKEVLLARTIPFETPIVKEVPIIKEVPVVPHEKEVFLARTMPVETTSIVKEVPVVKEVPFVQRYDYKPLLVARGDLVHGTELINKDIGLIPTTRSFVNPMYLRSDYGLKYGYDYPYYSHLHGNRLLRVTW